jgi:hypothetical protein
VNKFGDFTSGNFSEGGITKGNKSPKTSPHGIFIKKVVYNDIPLYVLEEERNGDFYTLLLSKGELPDDRIISRETDMPPAYLFYLTMKKKDYVKSLNGTTILDTSKFSVTLYILAKEDDLAIRSYGFLTKNVKSEKEVYNTFINSQFEPIINGVSTDSNMTKEEFSAYIKGFSPYE